MRELEQFKKELRSEIDDIKKGLDQIEEQKKANVFYHNIEMIAKACAFKKIAFWTCIAIIALFLMAILGNQVTIMENQNKIELTCAMHSDKK